MRVRAAVLAFALAAVLAPAGAGSAEAGADDLSLTAEACVWKSHKKRIVKRVRRDRRWVKVIRIRRWRTCEPLPPATVATPRLSVRAQEFSFVLSRPEVPAGELILEFNNSGEDPHDLKIAPVGSAEPQVEVAETPSLSRSTQRVTLGPPGAYVMWCSLPEHRERGMEAELQVSGGAG
jgi:plastocyanin